MAEDRMRQAHVNEMNRLREAINKTSSNYLRRDYGKKLSRMEKELKEYDEWHRVTNSGG